VLCHTDLTTEAPGSTSPNACSVVDTFVDYDAIGRQLQDQAGGTTGRRLLLLLPEKATAAVADVASGGTGASVPAGSHSRRELRQTHEVPGPPAEEGKPELPTAELSLHSEYTDEVVAKHTAAEVQAGGGPAASDDASNAAVSTAKAVNTTAGRVMEHRAPLPAPTAPGPLPLEVAIAAGVLPTTGVLRSRLATGAATAAASPPLTAEDKAKLARVSNPVVCQMLLQAFGAPPAQLGNSICNGGPWNTRWCSYDLGDCCMSTCKSDVVSAFQQSLLVVLSQCTQIANHLVLTKA
jgi:hypothetical protein